MTNTLNKIIHNGDEYGFPGIPNDTTGTTSIVSNIWTGTSSEYNLITPKEGQLSIILHEEGGGGWQPGANTLAYYPLNGDANDYSGNGYNGTWSNGAYYETVSASKQIALFSMDNPHTVITSGCGTNPKTLSFYMRFTSLGPTAQDWKQIIGNGIDSDKAWFFRANVGTSVANIKFVMMYSSNAYKEWNVNSIMSDQQYHHVCMVEDNGMLYNYIDGNLITSWSGVFSNNTFSTLYIGGSIGNNYNVGGAVGDVILESVAWSLTDIQNYFDQTKGDYGIS